MSNKRLFMKYLGLITWWILFLDTFSKAFVTKQENEKACGVLTLEATSRKKTLRSPGYPKGYKAGFSCEWNITAKQGYRVKLYFTDFDIGNTASVEMHCNDSIKLIGTSSLKQSYYSEDESLCLKFSSTTTGHGRRFLAKYKAYSCDNGVDVTLDKLCDSKKTCDWRKELDLFKDSSVQDEYRNLICEKCNGKKHNLDFCDWNCSSHYRDPSDNSCVDKCNLLAECFDETGGSMPVLPETSIIPCSDGMSRFEFKCFRNGKYRMISQMLLHDTTDECDDGEDLCYETEDISGRRELNSSRCFKCLDVDRIIPRHAVCDGDINCQDLSDECLCEERKNKVCQYVKMRGIKESDDEPNPCKPGLVHCGSNNCIKREKVCDGIADCDDMRDEIYCQDIKKCEFYKNCSDGKVCSCGIACNKTVLAKFKNGEVECEKYIREIQCNSSAATSGASVLENTRSCNEKKYFHCLIGYTNNYTDCQKCDFTVDCFGKEDEQSCSDDGRHYCENGIPLFVEKKQVGDGVKDCMDLSDECPSDSDEESGLSSRRRFVGQTWMKAAVWIMGSFSLIGNIVVIIGESKTVRKLLQRRSSAPQRTNHMLVLNLACADGLMGLYLLIIAILSVVYDQDFCEKSLTWHTHVMCTLMGVLVVTASETSVMTLLLLTAFRLFGVTRPFTAANRPKKSTVCALIAFIWLLSAFLALLPLATPLQYVFGETAILSRKGFYERTKVDFDVAKDLVKKIFIFDKSYINVTDKDFQGVDDSYSWNNLKTFLSTQDRIHYLDVEYYFGYYSDSNVCIPRLLVTTQDKAWVFTIVVTTFNFMAFLFVAVAYVYIISDSRNGAKKSGQTDNSEIEEMQFRVLRLVATDFFCWVPICIIVYINITLHEFPKDVYPVVAVVLLPINSALNPIMYSRYFERLWARVKPRLASTLSEVSEITSTDYKLASIPSSKETQVVMTYYSKTSEDS